jgi:TetR/AcrR family transcriptional repressor of lmrAB and yxaGH operons
MARTIAERSDVLPLLAEVFRHYGFEGASLARISAGTGLGKGSIYHFFPGGKDDMAAAVLAEIDAWFRLKVFAPLREGADARAGVDAMFDAVEAYFQSGQKVCLVGVFALGCERDRFAAQVRDYFAEWIGALAAALRRGGRGADGAQALAEEVVGAIQGALVLARALDRPAAFTEALRRLRLRLL